MPIDCTASFIDASEACNGRVLVCLRDLDTGSGYFKSFDSNGGNTSGSIYPSTGFQSGSNPPPYAQDYNVTDVPGYQCFYVPYNIATHASDVFVVQATDGSGADACELAFNVSTREQCGTAEPVYTCTNPQLQATAGQDLCISKSDLGVPDSNGVDCLVANIRFNPLVTFVTSDPACVARVPAGQIKTANSPLVMTFDVYCNNVAQALGCQATIDITSADCPDPVIVECRNGQVALIRGVAKTLSVSGCECCDANQITWSSPDPELAFNPVNGTTTQVTATASGSFAIEVECCAT